MILKQSMKKEIMMLEWNHDTFFLKGACQELFFEVTAHSLYPSRNFPAEVHSTVIKVIRKNKKVERGGSSGVSKKGG